MDLTWDRQTRSQSSNTRWRYFRGWQELWGWGSLTQAVREGLWEEVALGGNEKIQGDGGPGGRIGVGKGLGVRAWHLQGAGGRLSWGTVQAELRGSVLPLTLQGRRTSPHAEKERCLLRVL